MCKFCDIQYKADVHLIEMFELMRERERERQLSLDENNKELSTKKDSTIDYNLNHFQ